MDEKDINHAADPAEEINRAARESYRAAVDRAFDVQKSNMRLSRSFFENWLETLEDHAELNRRTALGLNEIVREQQEVFRRLSREAADAYDGFVESLGAYYEDVSGDPEKKGR
jgi:hypothetical protein